jgi:hypothetical protein
MWTGFILVYLSAYLTAWIAGAREGRPDGDERPAWVGLLSHVADAVGVIGMFLYSIGARLEGAWTDVWRGALVLLSCGVFLDSIYAHRLMLRSPHPELSLRGHELAVNAFMLLGMAFHLPMLWMNFRLAFPGPPTP